MFVCICPLFAPRASRCPLCMRAKGSPAEPGLVFLARRPQHGAAEGRMRRMPAMQQASWQDAVYEALRRAGIRQLAYVPDAGHARLIARAHEDPEMRAIVLTTEEEGVALAAGAWLGGERAALLMQSSGVGNCINMLSLARACCFPVLMVITMRGEWEEFNPWQVPMGSIVEPVLKLCDAEIYRARVPEEVDGLAEHAACRAFEHERIVALILSQRLIGKKVWTK